MATRKSQQPVIKKPLELTSPRLQTKEKLLERIDKGMAMRNVEIQNKKNLEDAKKNFTKWDDFNNELLKRLFTSEELYEEYRRWVDGKVMLRQKYLEDEISDHFDEINEKNHRLDSIIERLELIPESNCVGNTAMQATVPEQIVDKSKIFIVHGQDDSAKLEVARFIERVGFKPIILHEQASGSKTVIEKIEAYSDVGFGVIIYTPCDLGSINEKSAKLGGRARQNVVFEHGFLIGKLGRSKVCSLVKGDVDCPNDISGIVYMSMDSGSWKIELAKELREAGYQVDMNKVI